MRGVRAELPFLRQRLPFLAVLLVAAGWLAVLQFHGSVVPLPSFLSGVFLVGYLAPSLVAAGIIGSAQASTAALHESLSPRPVGWADRGWVPLLTLLAGGSWLAAAWWEAMAPPDAVAAARNLVGFVGVGLVARRVAPGATAAAAPVYLAVLAAVLGAPQVVILSWVHAEASVVWAAMMAAAWGVIGWLVGTGRAPLREAALQGIDR